MMADGYVSMLQLGGMAMMVAIRAALIPSSPRRTIIVTALFGAPTILVTTVLVPVVGGGLAWRALDSGAYPWLPATAAMIWGFAIITCTVISWVIYGLRAEVREARRLGQYTLEQKLGEGGMGVVYRASHAMLRRPTAIKLLLPDRAGKEALTRFEREVRRTAMLTHPNTVTVFDYGRTADGVFYYAMELLEGASLAEIVEVDGPQPGERVIHLLEQAAGSLAEAHDAGLIHRDVKPGNILVVDRGGIADLVKVVDFGLVKDVGVRARGGPTPEPALTLADTITGTPLYMAPETVTAPETVDARTDLYALGAVGYWLLTGTHVFGGHSIIEVCGHHKHSCPILPPRDSAVR
jgi:serine/threonine-protein kinase